MNGSIIADTPLAVDYWRVRPQDPPYLVHFLSHMHTDHTSGLSSSWRKPLYCSEITSKILRSKLQVCRSLIRVLPIGQPTIIPLDREGRETFTVTFIDANHCPGAVMFLFEGRFGTILYTADFKYTPTMFSEPGLESFPSIDTLYLDNTFNDPRCTWPSNDISAGFIENIITTAIGNSDIVIALYTLGKEELLVRIAKKFQRWLVVTPKRFEMLQLLELPNVFTTDKEASNIRVICQTEVTWKNLLRWGSNGRKTVVIVPSALSKLKGKKRAFDHPSVYLVPYTSHSSYPELQEFVRRIRPRRVLPIVSGSSDDVSNFEKLLSSEKPAVHKLPELLSNQPRNGCYVQPGTSFRNVKSNHHAERGRKRKIAQGVVFADSTDKMEGSALGSTHSPRMGGDEHSQVSGSVESICGGNPANINGGAESLPERVEPQNKKRRNGPGASHPDIDEDHEGGNIGNGIRLEVAVYNIETSPMSKRSESSQEAAQTGHGGSTITWSEKEDPVDIDVNGNGRQVPPDAELQGVGCVSKEANEVPQQESSAKERKRKRRKAKLAVIPVKHRHNFYQSFDKMRQMIKQHYNKQLDSS